MNTIRQLTQYALQELKDSYPEKEVISLCNIIYMDVLHYTNIDIHTRKNDTLSESFINIFFDIIRQLKSGKPIQYIIGETEFAGLKFRLDNHTLIPRPETEELILWISKHLACGQKILDIGTGSGCIAIAIASLCRDASVTSVDISKKAIRVAVENAEINCVNIQFLVRDILIYNEYEWDTYDIIVSNPPYVLESEKTLMHSRVLDYEPHRALFVPDSEPLLFYEKIAAFGRQYLKSGGCLFFEINEAFGKETIGLLHNYGYRNIELRKDIFEKDRMIKATK